MNARRAHKERELHLVIAELAETKGLSRDLILRLSETVNSVCDEHWVVVERLQERLDEVERRLEQSDDGKCMLEQQLACSEKEKVKYQLELARCSIEKEQLEHQLERSKSERDTWRARAEMIEKERLPITPSQEGKARVTKRRKRATMDGEEKSEQNFLSTGLENEIQEVQQSSQQSGVQLSSGPPTPSADSSAVEPWLRRPTPSRKPLEPTAPPPLPTVQELDESLRKRARNKRRSKVPTPKLPCQRCKLEKRKQMEEISKRRNKKVNEKVWERWVNTPGNCLEFMHADEPVINRDKEYDLSFSESETQSPSESEHDVRHESGIRIDTYGNTVDSEP